MGHDAKYIQHFVINNSCAPSALRIDWLDTTLQNLIIVFVLRPQITRPGLQLSPLPDNPRRPTRRIEDAKTHLRKTSAQTKKAGTEHVNYRALYAFGKYNEDENLYVPVLTPTTSPGTSGMSFLLMYASVDF